MKQAIHTLSLSLSLSQINDLKQQSYISLSLPLSLSCRRLRWLTGDYWGREGGEGGGGIERETGCEIVCVRACVCVCVCVCARARACAGIRLVSRDKILCFTNTQNFSLVLLLLTFKYALRKLGSLPLHSGPKVQTKKTNPTPIKFFQLRRRNSTKKIIIIAIIIKVFIQRNSN